VKGEHCGDPAHPHGVDDLDYHLRLGENLPTPDGCFECWLCPANEDGTSVRHGWDSRRWHDHMVLMRASRSEEGIDLRWNLLTTRQRKAYLDAALAQGLDPAFLQDFHPRTYRFAARKPNNPVIEYDDR
jgi:hypothetical protein